MSVVLVAGEEQHIGIDLLQVLGVLQLQLSQLVYASDQEKARKAVIEDFEKDGYTVLSCRVDDLIIGD